MIVTAVLEVEEFPRIIGDSKKMSRPYIVKIPARSMFRVKDPDFPSAHFIAGPTMVVDAVATLRVKGDWNGPDKSVASSMYEIH